MCSVHVLVINTDHRGVALCCIVCIVGDIQGGLGRAGLRVPCEGHVLILSDTGGRAGKHWEGWGSFYRTSY